MSVPIRRIAAALAMVAAAALTAGPASANERPAAVLDGNALSRAQLTELKRAHDVHVAVRPGRPARVFLDEAEFRRYVKRAYGAETGPTVTARAAAGGNSTLYEHINSGGYSINVAANTGLIDLGAVRFCGWLGTFCKTVNDRISSVDDHSGGGTELWEHANYSGSSVYVPPGWRVNLPDWAFNDVASSVKVYYY